jgi:hypothetical protein
MGALLDRFLAVEITFEPTGDGNLRALGPLTDELRSIIRTNKPAILAELAANDSALDARADCLQAKALAMLANNSELRIAVVAEAADAVLIGIAIRGVAYGELEVPAGRYDPFGLLTIIEQYGGEAA